MADVLTLRSDYVLSLTSNIRSKDATNETRHRALIELGSEIGEAIVEAYFLKSAEVLTSSGGSRLLPVRQTPLTVLATPRGDLSHLHQGLLRSIPNAHSAWVDFGGERDAERLKAVRGTSSWANVGQTPVHTLIIGKAVLATGCTAVELTRRAIGRYTPKHVIVTAVVWAESGVELIKREFPSATLIVVGEPDVLVEGDMLFPGLANVDNITLKEGSDVA